MQDARPGTLLVDRDGAIWLRGTRRTRCIAGADDMVTGDGRWVAGAYIDAVERYGPFTVIFPWAPGELAERLRVAEAVRGEAVAALEEIREFARTQSQGPAAPDDLWAIKEMVDKLILRCARLPGAAPAEAP